MPPKGRTGVPPVPKKPFFAIDMKGVILYNVISMEDINEIIRERLNKLEAIKSAGIDAYGSRFEKSTAIKELLNSFEDGKEARIAGRVMSIRGHGKSVFSDIKDQTARLQIYLKKDTIGDGQFELFGKIDIGDIIGVNGKLFKTKTGEVTLNVSEFVLLSKSLRPMPEKWHGLKDIETRYRQRYLDIIVNEDVREVFLTRTKIITMIRKFLDSRGYLEVETPMMQPIPGGATARPFITHHNALGIDLYLRIAPELYLKRLLVGGFEKVYEINRNFRNEGISTRHNPEFTMLEVYASYCDYTDMMRLAEDLFTDISSNLFECLIIEYKGVKIDLTPPWRRIGMLDILKEETGLDFSQVKDVKKAARELGVEAVEDKTRYEIINDIFEKIVEPKLVSPTFILDYPAELSPLSKRKKDNPLLVDRFELFVGGNELANAYSELNDPMEQSLRLKEQSKKRGEDSGFYDEDFITALEYGMPPAGGLGIGIDRLVMLFTNQDSIRDVILFPQLRPEK